MGYLNVGGKATQQQISQGWQFRISVNPSAITRDNINNKIDVIKEILKKYDSYKVSLKIGIIANEIDLYEGEYDCTTSRHGKDVEQRGKEICVYLPNSNEADSAATYKKLILNLWSDFQKADIPLMYIDVPGDRKISSLLGFPTPFSFTSSSQQKEWLNRHGILFKQFVGWDNEHPILQVKISKKDLKAHGIHFDPLVVAKSNRTYFKEHQALAFERLHRDIQAITSQEKICKDVLFDSNLENNIKDLIKDYREKIAKTDIDDRGAVQTEFDSAIENNPMLQALFNYPRKPDAKLSKHPSIKRIQEELKEVMEEEVDSLIEQLRTDYETELGDIKPDFDKHAKGNNQSLEMMNIDWSHYIPGYSDEKCSELIEKNPLQMQAVYRRVILLERERRGHEAFKKQWLKGYYNNDKIYTQLTSLAEQIGCMEKNFEFGVKNINQNMLNAFKTLYEKLEEELFSYEKHDINKTSYPIVIDHFRDLANKINEGKEITLAEITASSESLDAKLLNTPPSPGLRATICGVIGAVVGAILGFVVGAAVTSWGGGFGALPGAIAGYSLGGAVLGGSMVALVGFFTGKRAQATYFEKEQTKANMDNEVQAVYSSMGFSK